MPKYRYKIVNGATEVEFYPSNNIQLSKKKQMTSFGAWYSENSLSDILITAKKSKQAYQYLNEIVINSADYSIDNCTLFYLIVEQQIGVTQWNVIFQGEFTLRNVTHDMDLCYFTIKVTEKSIMQCFLRGLDKEFNMLAVPGIQTVELSSTDTIYSIGYAWTWQVETGTAVEPFPGTPSGVYWVMDSVLFEDYSGSTDYRLYLWYYQTQVTYCVAGAAVPPDTTGTWFNFTEQQTGNECGPDGLTEWRKIFGSDPLAVGLTSIVTSAEIPISSITANSLTAGLVSGPPTSYLAEINWGSIGTTTIPNGRSLIEVIDALAINACADVTALQCDFFKNDINYVTNSVEYASPVLFQITDIKYPSADVPASKAIITMRKLLSDLNKMFDLWWRVDDEGTLIIEHRTYFQSLELAENDFTNVDGYKKYQFSKDNLAGFRTYTSRAQSSIDFDGKPVEYAQPCVNSETENVSLELLCSDIRYITANPDTTPNDAIVIVATGGQEQVVTSIGKLSNVPTLNAPMSWANIHYWFHRHNAHTLNGTLNGQDNFGDETTFLRTIPLRTAKLNTKICDLSNVDILAPITTQLTEALNIAGGEIEDVKISLETCAAEINYSF